jgi:hypothetical protein
MAPERTVMSSQYSLYLSGLSHTTTPEPSTPPALRPAANVLVVAVQASLVRDGGGAVASPLRPGADECEHLGGESAPDEVAPRLSERRKGEQSNTCQEGHEQEHHPTWIATNCCT